MSIKNDIVQLAEKELEQYTQISKYIFDNPELCFEEKKAQEILTDHLKKVGFEVEKGVGGLGTSFEAIFNNGKGKTVAFIAEYDALPDIGHACGHNIIGTGAIAAGKILKDIMIKNDIKGTLKIIGTPAEEGGGGKIKMIEKGVFKNIDAAFILHPADNSMPDDVSFACKHLKIIFKGKASHAAAFPWKGASALNGIIELFNGINSLRLHLKDFSRVHGVITEGGSADNIIPERAEALFNIRALEINYLEEIEKRISECAQGAALITGTECEIIQLGETYKEIKNNKELVDIIRNNFNVIGEEYVERDLNQGIGSTDMGNLTHEIAGIQAYILLKKNIGTHTIEFAEASGGEEGKEALLKSIKILALSGYDVLIK